jgi:hypothetical protein
MTLAPIVLFVYNRPRHTEQTLNALMQNELADQSILYIYADGPKKSDTKDQLKNHAEVSQLIRAKKWCKEVHIIESSKNKGLAVSIIEGVTEIVNKYGKIIVLEDDLLTSNGFLKFMNEALNLYESEKKVMHISGYMYPVNKRLPKTLFFGQTSCWGWGTWDSRWKYLETSPKILMNQLESGNKINSADIDGTNQFIEHLKANINGTLNTWAVLWHFSVFLRDGLCLHPGNSLVSNIGMDNSGANCNETDLFEVKLVQNIRVKKIKIEDSTYIYKYLKQFYSPSSDPGFLFKSKRGIYNLSKRIGGKLINSFNFRF